MLLEEISFSEYLDGPREWKLESTSFESINLIVGTNSTGKSRLLNVIDGLAKLLSGQRKDLYSSGNYKVSLRSENYRAKYELNLENYKVLREMFTLNGEVVMNRGNTGEGKIKALELNNQIRFQVPTNQLAVVARRDSIQHPFFEELYEWATTVKLHQFASDKGKMVHFQPGVNDQNEDSKILDPTLALRVFVSGVTKHGDRFKSQVLQDFSDLGYECSDIGTMEISEYIREKIQLVGLYVQEKSLKSRTLQLNMSQGMHRALALVIHLNYESLENRSTCLLIDDVGEGLDFDRSSRMISLLIRKSKQMNMQLFMTTNDRFVMNGVPLEYWTVLRRDGSVVKAYNNANSQEIFEEFKFIGLNNFDFFSSGLYLGEK